MYQYLIRGLVNTVVVGHENAMEYIAAKIRAIRELGKKRKNQVSELLFIGIPKVEVIVSRRSQSSIAQSHDFLDDRRASKQLKLPQNEMGQDSTPNDALPGARYTEKLYQRVER